MSPYIDRVTNDRESRVVYSQPLFCFFVHLIKSGDDNFCKLLFLITGGKAGLCPLDFLFSYACLFCPFYVIYTRSRNLRTRRFRWPVSDVSPLFLPLKKKKSDIVTIIVLGEGMALNSSTALLLLLHKRCALVVLKLKKWEKPKSRVSHFCVEVWFLINVQLKTNSVVEHSSDGVTRSRQTDEGFSQGLQQHGHHRLVSITLHITLSTRFDALLNYHWTIS